MVAVFAQNSAAGYGQGGMGGGGGGLYRGRSGDLKGAVGLVPQGVDFISYNPTDNSLITNQDPSKVGHPEDDSTRELWTRKSAILTPGEDVKFKFKVEKGETLLAGVSSDAFDPVLSLEDEHGTALAKNDDREDGDQAPFIAYRFATAGEVTLKVLSSHSVAGGRFTLSSRTFISSDMPLGANTTSDVHLTALPDETRAVFRISAKKGTIYDIHFLTEQLKNARGSYFVNWRFNRVTTPSGVMAKDLAPIGNPDGAPVFEALSDGDYYAEFSWPADPSPVSAMFKTDLRIVETTQSKPSDDQSLSFKPGELRLVEFPVKAGQIVKTTIKGSQFRSVMSAPANANDEISKRVSVLEGNGAYGIEPGWAWFRLNVDASDTLVRVFKADGIARVAVRCSSGQPETLAFKNEESLPAWETGAALNESLEVGGSRLFMIKSTRSELMRVAATASHFLPRLDIFRLDGELANSLCNRITHVAGDDLYFPDAGTFIVRLSCEGDGGSGEFEMKREALDPIAYRLGGVQVLKLDGKNFGLYAVDLEANKRYQLMTDKPGQSLQIDLLDDDGQFLTSQDIGFDNVALHYFIPTRSGRHRLWLRGGPGDHTFKFELHVPPSFGGNPSSKAVSERA